MLNSGFIRRLSSLSVTVNYRQINAKSILRSYIKWIQWLFHRSETWREDKRYNITWYLDIFPDGDSLLKKKKDASDVALLFKKYANPPLKCDVAAHAAPWWRWSMTTAAAVTGCWCLPLVQSPGNPSACFPAPAPSTPPIHLPARPPTATPSYLCRVTLRERERVESDWN